MTTIAEIEHAIEKLPQQQFRELHRWIADRDASEWDAEIAADASKGRFDALRQRIRADYDAGLCADL
ncbi:MAG: uncharacterized protein JWR15_729 [Prosthecobacter sp.]|nr:uncharacterized protein [Prosthecobacter sp.]